MLHVVAERGDTSCEERRTVLSAPEYLLREEIMVGIAALSIYPYSKFLCREQHGPIPKSSYERWSRGRP